METPVWAEAVRRLVGRGWTLATAESLTGGLVGAGLTSVPGSSAVYAGGVVAYDRAVKTGLLGVPEELVAGAGVVSAACAEAMAAGARRVTGADVGLATTGVAGPGPQDGVPAGTAWVAVTTPTRTVARELRLPGDRDAVRRGTAEAAVALLLDEIQPSA